MESFYTYSNSFQKFTFEHWSSVGVFLIMGFYLLYLGRNRWNEIEQKKYITWVILFYLFTQWAEPCLKLNLGIFKIEENLPLHLCNVTPLFMLYVMHFKNRFWFGVFFFWIMCGTAQAMFTPTLTESFPHLEWLRYWAVHIGLVFTALYGLVVYKWKLEYKDVIFSFIGINLFAGFIHLVNLSLNSNYWYTIQKPPSPTLYDALGPWPTYMFQLEPLALIFFSAMYFIIKGISKIKI